MNITVRPITLDDAGGFHAALDSVARERRYLRLTEAPPLARSLQFIASNLESGNPQFVAADGEAIVGWCDICRSSEQDSEHCGGLGMGVVADHRGMGIGTKLVTATLNAARGHFERVDLDVYASNTPAIALYEKVGFALEGRRRQALLRDGVYDDIVMMGLLLS